MSSFNTDYGIQLFNYPQSIKLDKIIKNQHLNNNLNIAIVKMKFFVVFLIF